MSSFTFNYNKNTNTITTNVENVENKNQGDGISVAIPNPHMNHPKKIKYTVEIDYNSNNDKGEKIEKSILQNVSNGVYPKNIPLSKATVFPNWAPNYNPSGMMNYGPKRVIVVNPPTVMDTNVALASTSSQNDPVMKPRSKPRTILLPFKQHSLPQKLVIVKTEEKSQDFPEINFDKPLVINAGPALGMKANPAFGGKTIETLKIKADPFFKQEPVWKDSVKIKTSPPVQSSLNNTSISIDDVDTEPENDDINTSNDSIDMGDDDGDGEMDDYGDQSLLDHFGIDDFGEEDDVRAKKCERDIKRMESNIKRTKYLLRTGNLSRLPDKGKRLKDMLTKEMEELRVLKKKYSELILRPNRRWDNTRQLTLSKLEGLHDALLTRPTENTKAENPDGLLTKLMPHQQHALAWLLWREGQKPAGGILADDMGLGKTLTMISLIVATKERLLFDSDESDCDEFDWQRRNGDNPDAELQGGTLIIAPASILTQWSDEIERHCIPNCLKTKIHHGENRTKSPYKLLRYDVVISTYHILAREFTNREYKEYLLLTKIKWKRIILDEAHTIRNSATKFCDSACDLKADKRWTLTGTPIQNRESDLYAILKFLKCSPFDKKNVWKDIMRDKAGGHKRIATLMKSLMLRRTKGELEEKGMIERLPDKECQTIFIELDKQERAVYDKLLQHSQALFGQFLKMLEEKKAARELGLDPNTVIHNYPTSSRARNHPMFGAGNENVTVDQLNLLSRTVPQLKNLKMIYILVLILRLRQMCCHPSLINAELESNELEDSGISREDMKKSHPRIFQDIIDDDLNINNPLFEKKRKSTKIEAVLEKVDSILNSNDKIIIVSQWTSYLKLIGSFLNSIPGATYEYFTGETVIKERQSIVDNFNDEEHPKILLLSLCAGGVGLNLVGANHLFLVDIHWNPQLEKQAQDRIYRFGQSKKVNIYKFLTNNTIEEQVKLLQDHKLEIASAILENGKFTGNRLTLGEIRQLFGMKFIRHSGDIIGKESPVSGELFDNEFSSCRSSSRLFSYASGVLLLTGAVYEVSHKWTLGTAFCDIWTSADVLCCTASILHLVAIASDRYWAVTNIDYINQRTSKRIGMMIFVIWMVSLLICIAPFFGWKDSQWEKRVIVDHICLVSQEIGYQIFATISSFYLPFLIILILYWRIFQTARTRIRKRIRGQPINAPGTTRSMGEVPKSIDTGHAVGDALAQAQISGGIAAAVVTIIGRPLPTISETTTTAFTTINSTNPSPEKTSQHNGLETDLPTMVESSPKPVIIKRKKPAGESKRERKAAKTLVIITGVFVGCWLPFFIIAILLPACKSCDIGPYVIALFQWLGYFNSTLNPIIYTIFSPEFRSAFKKILCRRRRRAVERRRGVRYYM